MISTSGKKKFNKFRDKNKRWIPVGKVGKILHFIQMIIPFFRDDGYYCYRVLCQKKKIQYKILRDTNWLAVTTHSYGKIHKLHYTEQVVKYFEYKNMVIQRRAQYVIIFLTIAVIFMASVEIYLNFFVPLTLT